MELPVIKVGVVQATPAIFDLEKSIAIAVDWIEKGAAAGCELLLFPESFLPGYPRGLRFDAIVGKRTEAGRNSWLDYWQNSVDVRSDALKPIQGAIKRAGIYVALGVTEREATGGSLYCSLLYFSREGHLLGTHRKLKPTGLERYIWAEGDGSSLHSFSTPIGKIGGLICWENYMPLARMGLFQKGVDIYLAPTADARPSWQASMQHIALEGRCFVLAANQYVCKSDYPELYQKEIKDEPEVMSAGGSVIYSPMGELLAGPLWNEEGLLVADLDFSVLAKSKLDFDVVGHYARSDVFKLQVPEQPEIKIID
ncbi:carbon-nitrogen hydrolase family protein [Persicitalea jodogahamensis]|uniref:Nitrilase n=1 Tax=Persicitalea jodogahamensis TaxID=402147 RepID=A0A8J3GAJ9_9BACT|nr:carbon-nitrogen hydrolase family protein [Persicitalea jodogahamensis]GHB80774.1 nitrilase [Persicitalea jodogahamensis]